MTNQTRALTPMARTQAMIAARKTELAKMLPEHVSIERMERAFNNALMRAPEIAECDPTSVYDSVMRCAQDGLIPDGREAAIVVFGGKNGKKAQYMPMVDGLLKLMRQSKEILSVVAHCVFDGDDFEYRIEDGTARLNHVPDVFAAGNRAFKGVYAIAVMRSGEKVIEVMGKHDVDKVRAVSRSGNAQYGPWAQWYDRMAIKSVLRRLVRRLPSSSEMTSVIESIDRDIDARFDKARDITPVQEQRDVGDFVAAHDDFNPGYEENQVDDAQPVSAQAASPVSDADFDPESF